MANLLNRIIGGTNNSGQTTILCPTFFVDELTSIMLKKFIAGIVLAFSAFSTQAELVTMTDYYLDGFEWSPATGGIGSIHYREYRNGENRGVSFQVNVAPFAYRYDTPFSSIDYDIGMPIFDPVHTISNWLTPVAGSGYTFDPVELYGIWAENVIFSNAMGLGIATWEGGNIRKINFPYGYSSWTVTKIDAQVSSVPEPGSLILLSVGLLCMATQMRRNKSEPISEN